MWRLGWAQGGHIAEKLQADAAAGGAGPLLLQDLQTAAAHSQFFSPSTGCSGPRCVLCVGHPQKTRLEPAFMESPSSRGSRRVRGLPGSGRMTPGVCRPGGTGDGGTERLGPALLVVWPVSTWAEGSSVAAHWVSTLLQVPQTLWGSEFMGRSGSLGLLTDFLCPGDYVP